MNDGIRFEERSQLRWIALPSMQRVLYSQIECEKELTETMSILKQVGGKWEWILNPSTQTKSLASFLKRQSFSKTKILTCMALERSRLKEIRFQPNFAYRKVENLEDLKVWISTASSVYRFIDEQQSLYLKTFTNSLLSLTDFEFYIGYIDQKPAVTTLLFRPENGVCGIYLVATIEEERKKGLASTLLHELICHKIDPNEIVILQSTEKGKNVYLSLGFQDYGVMDIFQGSF